MKRPTVRNARITDIAVLCELAKEFITASKWPFTYDEAVVIDQMCKYILQDHSEVLLVMVDEQVAGGAIVVAAQDLTAEKQGFLHKLFIKEEYRKTLAPLVLAKACAKWFDDQNCPVSFSTSTGNLSLESICAYTKLMRKYGYLDTGPTLYRIRETHGQISTDSSSNSRAVDIR